MKRHQSDKHEYSTIPQLLRERAQKNPDDYLQFYKDKTGAFVGVTYRTIFWEMLFFANGLLALGAEPGERIGLISDNRREWLVCSLGIMALGGCDIPRGSEATVKDLAYILRFAGCRFVVAESSYSLEKILECKNELPNLECVILIDPKGWKTNGKKKGKAKKKDKDSNKKKCDLKLFSYEEVMDLGEKLIMLTGPTLRSIMKDGTEDTTATIIFTSGTTGVPKGVELTHGNFLSQLDAMESLFPLKSGDKALCVLPVWHIYEREMEYFFLYKGVALCYSKPVVSMILADMKKIRPQCMACVPRIWEAIYKAVHKQIKSASVGRWMLFSAITAATITIRKMHDIILGRSLRFKRPLVIMQILNKALYIPILFLLGFKILGEMFFFGSVKENFGGRFKIGTSGGGGLAPKLDRFFNAVGIRIIEVYGLTETAPFCCIRNYRHPVLGTIGSLLPFCEGRVVDRSGNECKPGQQGVLYVRGPHVMKGYYNQPELTADVLHDGWFDTGDLVVKTYRGEIIVKGRKKDTIVLRSGENVEPFPIECKLEESEYIARAVVVGQDKNCLGALIVPAKDALKDYALQNGIDTANMAAVLKSEQVRSLIFKEMERLITPKNGFKPFERIGKFIFIDKQFEVGAELSAKGGILRHKIAELYKWQILTLYSDNAMVQNLGSMIPPNLPNLSNMIPANIPNLDELKSILQGKKKESEDNQD